MIVCVGQIPPKLRTLRMREVYDGFRLLEEPRTAALRQLFLGEYGERLVVRADAFAAEVRSGQGPASQRASERRDLARSASWSSAAP